MEWPVVKYLKLDLKRLVKMNGLGLWFSYTTTLLLGDSMNTITLVLLVTMLLLPLNRFCHSSVDFSQLFRGFRIMVISIQWHWSPNIVRWQTSRYPVVDIQTRTKVYTYSQLRNLSKTPIKSQYKIMFTFFFQKGSFINHLDMKANVHITT